MKKLTLLLVAAFIGTAIMVGCSNSTKPIDNSVILNDEFAPFGTNNELPAFGDSLIVDLTSPGEEWLTGDSAFVDTLFPDTITIIDTTITFDTVLVTDTVYVTDSTIIDTSCTMAYAWAIDTVCYLDTSLVPPDSICRLDTIITIDTTCFVDTVYITDSTIIDTSCTMSYGWIVDTVCYLDTSLVPPDSVCYEETIPIADTSCIIDTIIVYDSTIIDTTYVIVPNYGIDTVYAADTTGYQPGDSLRDFDVYYLRLVWGNLEGDSASDQLTDWSGKLGIGRGGIIVTRLIRFEPEQDYLLPQMSVLPEEIGWVSYTSTHYDGLMVSIIVPHSYTEELVLFHYHSAQMEMSIPVYQLNDMDTLITIGPGNALSIQSLWCHPHHRTYPVQRGFLAGRWGYDDGGNGVFFGRWMSIDGTLAGTLGGRWRTDDQGRSIFVGKYIDNDGGFVGFVRGTWYRRGMSEHAAGHFQGYLYNAERQIIGILGGHFKQGEVRRGGFLAGRWCVGCLDM